MVAEVSRGDFDAQRDINGLVHRFDVVSALTLWRSVPLLMALYLH
jgi:hypothetical protein